MTVYRSLIWNSWSWSSLGPLTLLQSYNLSLSHFIPTINISSIPNTFFSSSLPRPLLLISPREQTWSQGRFCRPQPCPAVALPSLLELQMNVWTSPRGYSFPCAADQLSSALPQDLPSVLPPPLLHLPLFLLSLISPHPNLPARGNAVFPPPHSRMQEQPTLCCQ